MEMSSSTETCCRFRVVIAVAAQTGMEKRRQYTGFERRLCRMGRQVCQWSISGCVQGGSSLPSLLVRLLQMSSRLPIRYDVSAGSANDRAMSLNVGNMTDQHATCSCWADSVLLDRAYGGLNESHSQNQSPMVWLGQGSANGRFPC